jgi:hypothetical protein
MPTSLLDVLAEVMRSSEESAALTLPIQDHS